MVSDVIRAVSWHVQVIAFQFGRRKTTSREAPFTITRDSDGYRYIDRPRRQFNDIMRSFQWTTTRNSFRKLFGWVVRRFYDIARPCAEESKIAPIGTENEGQAWKILILSPMLIWSLLLVFDGVQGSFFCLASNLWRNPTIIWRGMYLFLNRGRPRRHELFQNRDCATSVK